MPVRCQFTAHEVILERQSADGSPGLALPLDQRSIKSRDMTGFVFKQCVCMLPGDRRLSKFCV